MGKKVSEYTTAATVFASGDLFDLTKLVRTSPDVYESQKANANLLAGWNLFGQDQTMPAPRLHNLSNNQLSLTNGRLLLKGSDNIGTDLLKLESLAGTEVFKALNNGTIKISNAFTLPVADGTTGQALLTDGAGAVSFGNVASNTLYNASDTIGAGRVATITDSLTFSGGKVILSSVTDGILLNRVTTSEMDLITGMADNEIVFNTDLKALYRYDTANWVALAAGFGLVSITDANGAPKFFADLASAITNAITDDTINLHTDQVLTAQLDIDKRLTINMNGYTISFDSSGTDDTINILYTSTVTNVFSFINGGKVLRTGGTYSFNSKLSMNFNVSKDILDMGVTTFENNFGHAVTITSQETAKGGFIFAEKVGVSLGTSLSNSNITSYDDRAVYSGSTSQYFVLNCVINAPNAAAVDRASARNCNITGQIGISNTIGNISNNTIASTSHGIIGGRIVSNNNITAGGKGITGGTGQTITGNTIISVNEAVNVGTNALILSNPLLKSTANSVISGNQFSDVINNTIISTSNNSSHHGIKYGNPGVDSVASGNLIEVANAGANAINSAGSTTVVYSVNNTFKGMTTPLSIAAGNAQTNNIDNEGSILIG